MTRRRGALLLAALLLSLPLQGSGLVQALARCDGSTPDTEVAAHLEALAKMGPAASEAIPVLLQLLPERAPLWKDRDKLEVIRLRGFLLATLAKIGPPDEALPYVLAELSSAKHPYLIAAAARVAEVMGAGEAAPYLERVLEPGFHDEPLSLERYDPVFPAEEGTTARQEARKALRTLASPARGKAVTPWLEPGERPEIRSLDLTAVDQEGKAVNLKALADRPMALSFFYARCDNPKRCSLVTATLARLQKDLEVGEMGERVRLVLATFEPQADTPAELKRYGLDRGFRFGDGARMLRPDPVGEARLLEELKAPVNFSAGWVNVHGLALHLFDRRGRYVRTYHSVLWDNGDVLADLRRLAAE